MRCVAGDTDLFYQKLTLTLGVHPVEEVWHRSFPITFHFGMCRKLYIYIHNDFPRFLIWQIALLLAMGDHCNGKELRYPSPHLSPPMPIINVNSLKRALLHSCIMRFLMNVINLQHSLQKESFEMLYILCCTLTGAKE